jgi:hypothetical protein
MNIAVLVGYTTETMTIEALDSVFELNSEIQTDGFSIRNSTVYDCTTTYSSGSLLIASIVVTTNLFKLTPPKSYESATCWCLAELFFYVLVASFVWNALKLWLHLDGCWVNPFGAARRAYRSKGSTCNARVWTTENHTKHDAVLWSLWEALLRKSLKLSVILVTSDKVTI